MSYPSFDVDKKYTVMQNIGKGSAGSVFMCKSKRDHKTYALKQIFLDRRKKSRNKDTVLREVQILQKLDHPHIVHYHEAFFDRKQDNLFIIQDYCARGSLHEKVKASRQKNGLIPERQVMEWYVQITMALRYIHGKRVLHRDLKTQNVFLTKANMIKIGDFGIARVLEHTVDMASTCVGTPCYLSPEICQDKPYNSKSDVWALGCLLYELCALKPAFNASNLVSLCYKIVKGSYDDIPPMYSNLVKMLIEKSLQKSPENRPTATAILNLPEVKEQLSVYITDKETERQSAHPAKRGQPGFNKNRRVNARPSVVNIGATNQKRAVKKPKKASGNSNSKVGTKKKKKKSKAEVQEAEDVKKLPDEIIPSNRPVAPGRLQDPFKPSEDLPPILQHGALIGYSPPTIRREEPPQPQPQPSPRSFLNQDKKVFMNEFSTQPAYNRPATSGPPSNTSRYEPPVRIPRDVTPPRDVTLPRDVMPPRDFTPHEVAKAPQFTPSSEISDNTTAPPTTENSKRDFAPPKSSSPQFSNHSNIVDSRTYAKPPSTPLYRIPKANKSRSAPAVGKVREEPEQEAGVTQEGAPEQECVTEERVEVDGTLNTSTLLNTTTPSETLPIHMTSPLNASSVLNRDEGEGKITPLPELTYQVPVPQQEEQEKSDKLPGVGLVGKWGVSNSGMPQAGDTIEIGLSETGTLKTPFKALQDQAELLPGQVEVGWSVAGPGETHGFIPQDMDRPVSNMEPNSCSPAQISPAPNYPTDPVTVEFAVDSNQIENDDNLNLNLDDVPENQFPNLPSEKSDNDSEEEIIEEEDYEYSDDFEDYEEIPDFENVEDIPDITTPGEENEADSDEENEVFEMAMKSAKVALDNIEEEEDEEFVEDYVIPTSAGNIAALRQFCVNTLGVALFRDVQMACQEFQDNYDSHDTFLKKLERIAGPDKLEICLMVDEFFADE